MRCFAGWLIVILAPAAWAAEPISPDAFALRILDSEALYTVAGGLKPISDGFWQTRFPDSQHSSPDVEAARLVLAALPLGPDLEAGVFVFAAPFNHERTASAFVAHRPALNRLLTRHADVFAPLGIPPDTLAQQVLERIDRAPRAARWRAFGLVFGYPEHAVEFFVQAGEQHAKTGTFIERDFIQLPTFASDEGRFVYAVPKRHVARVEDWQLKRTTADTFARYQAWRRVYRDHLNRGGAELLQNWIAPPPPPTVRSDCHRPH